MADAVPWDDDTDDFITDIDAGSKDAALSLRDLLTDPRRAMKEARLCKDDRRSPHPHGWIFQFAA